MVWAAAPMPAGAQGLLGAVTGATKPAANASASPAAPTLTTARAVVQLNNRFLFQVYSSGDRNAQDRADLANLRLADALRSLPRNGVVQPPEVSVDSTGPQQVIKLDGKPLLTVTQADADGAGQTTDALAAAWAARIRQAFAETLRERQPAYLRWAVIRAAWLAGTGILLSLLLWLAARRWRTHPGWPVFVLLWLILGRLILDLFPQTRPGVAWVFLGPPRSLMIFVGMGLVAATLARFWAFVLIRLFPPLPDKLTPEERTERTFRRRATLGDVARFTGVTFIWILAMIVAVSWVGVNLPALLASAGLIGVAISLAAQDSAKDLVAGINILADDRFGVGDTIQVGAYSGRVERITLRITQLRDSTGQLVTLPNRSIVEVANATARWAQVDFKVGVSYYDDLGRAMDILRECAEAVAADWPERVLSPPELLGVDAFNDANVSLRLQMRTPPGDQWVVARELRARVKAKFDEAGIAILNTLYAPPLAPARDSGGSAKKPAPQAAQAQSEQAPKDAPSPPPGPAGIDAPVGEQAINATQEKRP